MRDLSAFIIPKTLDDPEKILFFTYPEIAILMTPTIFGLASGYVIRGLVAGAICLIISKKLSPSNKDFNLSHLVYWYCPEWLFRTTVLPPSHTKVFLG